MEIETFVNNFAAQFDETDVALFKPEAEIRSIDEWSSIVALSIIAMVDEEYNIKITGDDIRKSITIEDLYNIVVSRK